MFQDINKNLNYLKGAYKKLKSYYHYNKSMFFIRKKIAIFESSENFENTFIMLAESLKDSLRHKEYFDNLYKDIDSRILPKKFEDNNPNGIAATSNYFKEEKFLKRVNYYIDAPIELLILELTDIKARAALKSLVNTVYAIEFNSDTNYYSNLVESLSRDIQAFVVQVNTAQYGDSRITAPYKSEKKIL